MSTESELENLTRIIREFAQQRDWERFHTPKNLAMAIAGEAGELAAEFQWLTPSESEPSSLSNDQRRSIELEIADVQIYLLRLADVLGVNISQVVKEKVEINESRF